MRVRDRYVEEAFKWVCICIVVPLSTAMLAMVYYVSQPENYQEKYWAEIDWRNRMADEQNRAMYAPRDQVPLHHRQDQDVLFDKGPSESDKAIERMNREFQEKIKASAYE